MNAIFRIVMISIAGTVQFILIIGGVMYYGEGHIGRELIRVIAPAAALISLVWPAYMLKSLKLPQ